MDKAQTRLIVRFFFIAPAGGDGGGGLGRSGGFDRTGFGEATLAAGGLQPKHDSGHAVVMAFWVTVQQAADTRGACYGSCTSSRALNWGDSQLSVRLCSCPWHTGRSTQQGCAYPGSGRLSSAWGA